jgi:hypothetical protein
LGSSRSRKSLKPVMCRDGIIAKGSLPRPGMNSKALCKQMHPLTQQ